MSFHQLDKAKEVMVPVCVQTECASAPPKPPLFADQTDERAAGRSGVPAEWLNDEGWTPGNDRGGELRNTRSLAATAGTQPRARDDLLARAGCRELPPLLLRIRKRRISSSLRRVRTDGRDGWPIRAGTTDPSPRLHGLATPCGPCSKPGESHGQCAWCCAAEPITSTNRWNSVPEDSGAEEAPVVYAAAAGEKVVLSGGRRIEERSLGRTQRDEGLGDGHPGSEGRNAVVVTKDSEEVRG